MRSHGSTAVMHFAAFAYVGESVTAPELYYRNNVVGTLVAARCDARGRGRDDRLLVDLRGVRRFRRPCRFARRPPRRPLNPYGDTKLAIERALHWYGGAYGLRYAALRYFNAAGADPDGEIGEDHDPETHLIPLVLRAALGRGDPLQIFGTDYPTRDGTAIRDYIHVTDLADAHVRALARLAAGEREHGAQSRHRQRPFGARGHRGGRARRRPAGAAARGAAPARRPARARRRPGARPRAARLAPATFRSGHDRAHRAGLGDPAGTIAG